MGFQPLHTHRLLMRIALSAAHVFAWIFVFEYFYIIEGSISIALARLVLLYALSQTITCLLTPYAARQLRNGMRREMICAVLMLSAAFIILGAVFEGWFGGYFTLAIAGFAILIGFYRALYWIPYEIEKNLIVQRPGVFDEVLIALMPAFAGLALAVAWVHEPWVLFAAGALLLISIIPLSFIPDTYERFPWGYRETFGVVFARSHRLPFFNAIADGVQGAALLLLWPLAIFLLAGWSYPLFGILFSFTFLLLIVARGYIETFMRHMRIFDSVPVRVAIASSSWIGRILVLSPLSVVVVDAYGHNGYQRAASINHASFEQNADAGNYIDEYTVLREVGLSIGRIALCCFAALLAVLYSAPFAFATSFLAAAIAAGLSVLLSQSGTHRQI